MAEKGEEPRELQQLAPLLVKTDSEKPRSQTEPTTPLTPGVSKVTQTSPTSPVTGPKVSVSSLGLSQSIQSKQGRASSLSKVTYVNEKASKHLLHPDTVTLGRDRPSVTRMLNKRRVVVSSRAHAGPPVDRSCQHHSFISDLADVRHMESALLQLLDDFHSGKLRAFGKDCSMEQMEAIREQQEKLTRLHFDLGAQQELFAPLSEEGLRNANENMHRLMDSLEQLSVSIERLHTSSSDSWEGSASALPTDT